MNRNYRRVASKYQIILSVSRCGRPSHNKATPKELEKISMHGIVANITIIREHAKILPESKIIGKIFSKKDFCMTQLRFNRFDSSIPGKPSIIVCRPDRRARRR